MNNYMGIISLREAAVKQQAKLVHGLSFEACTSLDRSAVSALRQACETMQAVCEKYLTTDRELNEAVGAGPEAVAVYPLAMVPKGDG